MKTIIVNKLQIWKFSSYCKIIILVLILLVFTQCKKDFEQVNTSLALHLESLSQSSKPNIVFILSDDIGYEVPTVDGGESYSTPNIDRMAVARMRFTQCYSSPI